ncbi:MAG: T9SS type A sorting domain-containing protein [Bacteroidales bacterium]|nr:T9SS type A sorting domain-containing protein [Bacteroidales bacterium]
MIIRGVLAIILGLISSQFSYSTDLINENFVSGIPVTWTASGVTATTSSGKTCASMTTNGYLITPSLYKPGALTFSHRASGNGKTLTIEKSTNGTDWTVIGTISPSSASAWGSSSISINENNSGVSIRFTCSSATIFITDIIITAGAHPVITASKSSITFPGLYLSEEYSVSDSFTVSQADLTNQIDIAAPSDFQLSFNNSNFFTNLAILNGSITKTIYARYAPSAAKGTQTANIQLTSTGAATVNVQVTATSIATEPTTQGSISVSGITGTTAQITVSGGNGNGKLLVGKALYSNSFEPQDATIYTTSTDFSSGTAQSDSSIVLYSGIDNTFPISGLESGTQYYLKLYSYNVGSGNSQNYLTVNPGSANFQTLTVPGISTTPSNLGFSYTLINDSSVKSCQVSGKFLTPAAGNITVNASSDFTVSASQDGSYSSTLQIPYSSETLGTTTLYVKFKPTSENNYSDKIILSGGGASDTLNVSGIGVNVMPVLPKAYYLSPTGNDNDNDGSFDSPWFNLSKAVTIAEPGDTIYVRGGTYLYTSVIRMTKSGQEGKRIHIFAYKNGDTFETPIFDFSTMTCEGDNCSSSRGLYITGNYWYIFGIHITKALDNGIKMEGSHNIVERCVFSFNGDSGIQLGFGHTITFTQDGSYCAFNYIIDCDSYRNYDPDSRGGDADGFACKMHNGMQNWFIRCRAWENSDDAWDLYETDFPVYIIECWGWSSGDASEHPVEGGSFQGNGNGIKCGGNGTGGSSKGKHEVWNCVAFNNNKTSSVKGFDQNSHKGGVKIVNCLGFNNGYDFMFEDAPNSGITNDFYNNVCLGRLEINSTGSIQERNTATNNTEDGWQNPLDLDITAADYTDLSEEASIAPRGANGSMPTGFARIVEGSNLIDTGLILTYPVPSIDQTLVGNALEAYRQAVYGTTRDLGPYEVQEGEIIHPVNVLITPFISASLKIYPNPMSDYGYIQFSTDESTHATLCIYQLDGRIVDILFDGESLKGLSYQIPVITNNYKNGIYICILKGNSNILTIRKIIINK